MTEIEFSHKTPTNTRTSFNPIFDQHGRVITITDQRPTPQFESVPNHLQLGEQAYRNERFEHMFRRQRHYTNDSEPIYVMLIIFCIGLDVILLAINITS
jgi:hypothetical protein